MSNYDFFELKYLEEIYALYLECKEIGDFNGLNLFNSPKDNFMDVFDFIFDSIEIIEDENDEDDVNDDDEYYSMLK